MATEGAMELVLEYPESIFNGELPAGFGMDIGGTLTKLAYATKKDDSVLIHLVTYPKDKLKQSIPDMKARMSHCITPGQNVFTTGVGCNQFMDVINAGLDVNLMNKYESEANAEALKFYIQRLPLSEYVYPTPESIQPFITKQHEVFTRMAEMMKMDKKLKPFDVQPLENVAPPEEGAKLKIEDVFPCLVCALGSGAFYTLLDEDGTSEMLDINTSCGRMFMGLGSLLTGAKSFDELVALAEAGDDSNVETKCKHIRDPEKQDMYAMLPDDTPIYCFGRTVDKDISDFKREDLAAGLVSQLAQHMAQSCHLANMCSDVKMVFFCGTVCDNDLIRAELTKHFTMKNLIMKPKFKRDFYFLKNGGHLGSLGCLLLGLSNNNIPEPSVEES